MGQGHSSLRRRIQHGRSVFLCEKASNLLVNGNIIVFGICRFQRIEQVLVALYALSCIVDAFFGCPIDSFTEDLFGQIQLPSQLWNVIAAFRSFHGRLKAFLDGLLDESLGSWVVVKDFRRIMAGNCLQFMRQVGSCRETEDVKKT